MDVLLPSEIEFYIDKMRTQEIIDLGTSKWLDWHERLHKLNQQAMIEAAEMKEEFVKEVLITNNKTSVLVHEAILINIWKHKVLPLLLQLKSNPETTFIVYAILFHEGITVSLIELIMFHGSGCESLNDYAADLLEYAYDNAAQLLVITVKQELVENGMQTILRQKEQIAFDIGIRCLSILRYFAEHIDRASVSIVTRNYNTYDVPLLLVQVLIQKPWFNDGKFYLNGNWVEGEFEGVCQTEAQVWLGLHSLLLDDNCLKFYKITDCRRSQLIKLLPMMTPTLLDQIAPLVKLNHWLHQMSLSNLPCVPYEPILLEAILEIKNAILKENERKWKKIAKEQMHVVFCDDKKELSKIAQKLSAAFNTDLLEKFIAKPTGSCKSCGHDAMQRCSKCKLEWYCSRKCQVNDWKNHKDKCYTRSENDAGSGN